MEALSFPVPHPDETTITMKKQRAKRWKDRAVALDWGACGRQALLDHMLDVSEEMPSIFRCR